MQIYAKTDKGFVRSINQDCFDFEIINENFAWAVVCDGMGGTNSGEVASNLAAVSVKKSINENYKDSMTDDEIKDLLTKSIKTANDEILKKAQENKDYLGMGTTIVLAIATDHSVHVAHVGDSRAYFISSGEIEQITTDHSMVQEMVESGEITEEQAKNHPKKNIITRALGVGKDIEVDHATRNFGNGNVLLMCTDGLSNYIDENEIFNYFKRYNRLDLADSFISRANELGGNDNITVLIISY